MPANEPLTVTQLSNSIKGVVETNFSSVVVKGEVSGLKRASSGHIYFSLKDENSVINAIIWKGTPAPHQLADGLEVICRGKVTTFAGNSRYQIVINSIEASGVGALLKLLEELKQKLSQEGLFDSVHKKPIPFFPKTIGVVTSPTGAVIRDIIHRVSERFPSHIIVYPTAVQGEGAATQIANAINHFNKSDKITKPDVLIVARGGGSLEDLWCFNEEIVVRAAFASDIPIISAVGHETDTTLIDYVSDLRAPTPTGAAEKATPVKQDLIAGIDILQSRLSLGAIKLVENKGNKLTIMEKSLPDISSLVNTFSQKIDYQAEVLEKKFSQIYMNIGAKFEMASRMLETVSYKSILNKGFALVLDSKNNPVTSALKLPNDNKLNLQFIDGEVKTIIENKENKTKVKPIPKEKTKKAPPNQGSLF